MNILMREWKRLLGTTTGRNTVWMAAGQGTSVLLQAGYFVILARLLGAVEYGVYGGAFALAMLVSLYTTLGSGMVLLRYVSGEPTKFAVYWGNLLFVTVTVGTTMTIVLSFLGPHFLNARSATLLPLAAISNCICAQVTGETGRVFQAFEKLRFTAGLNLLTNLMRVIAAGGMILVMHRATAWQWSVASTAVSLISMLIAITTVTVLLGRPRLDLRLSLKHGAEGIGYSFAASTTGVYNDIDKTLLSHYGMNYANGIYTMAYRVIDIATIPISSIQLATMPKLFREGQQGVRATSEVTNRLLKRTIPLGASLSLAIFVTAPLIPHIVGRGFSDSVHAVRWLCLIPFFRGIHQITGFALTAAGLQKYRTTSQVIAATMNCGMNVWLIPRYGWYGAAWASLLTDGLLVVANWTLLQFVLRKDAQSTTEVSEQPSGNS
jgi:O-antigen/teichoic acid export membrane protein